MITWMQKHRKYLVVTIWISTIAFVGAGFVGWGVYDYNTDRASSVAKVGEEKITIKQFQNAYSNLYNYYNEKVFKGTLTKEKAKELKLDNLTINQLIREALLLNYAHDLGIGALDKELKEKLVNMKIFQKNGVFDKDQYYLVLKRIGQKPKEFEDGLKKEIVLNKLRSIISPKTTVLEEEVFGASFFMEDKLEISTIKTADINVSIDENQTKEFWQKNKNRYVKATTYETEVIRVGQKDINITENEISDFYKSEKFRYKDEKGKILSLDKAKDKVAKDLRFKKAKKIALKKYLLLKKGKIKAEEKVTFTQMSDKEILQKLKNAKKGDILKPIKEKSGYLVIKLDIINLPKPMNYEEAKDLAKADLIQTKKLELLEKKAMTMLNDFKGKEIGFISRDDYKKLEEENFDQNEAVELLNNIFASTQKRGYYIFKDKAVLYKILEQKLLDDKKLKENKDIIVQNINKLKESAVENSLIAKLQNRYKIEKYYK